MKTITVLGNNSGRNAGDNAILGNLLDDFADNYLLGEKSRKPLTIKAYVADVKRYLHYLQQDDEALLNI
jgi:hypothetical protein